MPKDTITFLLDAYCPKCGCQIGEHDILKWPNPTSWFGGTGSARCSFCRLKFAVQAAKQVKPPTKIPVPDGAWK